jgi:hypothetical protein
MNLKNVKHLNKFRRLRYSKNEMLIIGSGTLALLGLKDNKDVDIWATKNVMNKLSSDKNFIPKKSKLDKSLMYESKDGLIEFMETLQPFKNVKDHLKRAIVLYGIHFQSPKDVLKWKKYMNRPKDQLDIKLLEKYLSGNLAEYYLNALWMLR